MITSSASSAAVSPITLANTTCEHVFAGGVRYALCRIYTRVYVCVCDVQITILLQFFPRSYIVIIVTGLSKNVTRHNNNVTTRERSRLFITQYCYRFKLVISEVLTLVDRAKIECDPTDDVMTERENRVRNRFALRRWFRKVFIRVLAFVYTTDNSFAFYHERNLTRVRPLEKPRITHIRW